MAGQLASRTMSDAAARRALVAAITTTTVTVLPVFLLGGLAVQVGADLGFGPAGLGLAVALYFAVSALTSLPAGALVERYGATLTSRVGITVVAAALLAIGLGARSYGALVGALLLSACGNALGQLSSNVVLARGVPTRRQGLSFGVKQSAIPLCTLLAGAAVPTIALTVGWRWAFVLAAALSLAALPLTVGGTSGSRRDGGTAIPRSGRRPHWSSSGRARRSPRGPRARWASSWWTRRCPKG